MAKEIIIYAPFDGKVKELKDVEDPVFSKEMVGKGLAITPNQSVKTILAPIKGKVKVAFEGGHAYGIDFKKAELLLHIGIETVQLKGEGFEPKAKVGDKVKKDTILSGVNFKTIKEKAVSTDTLVLITTETIGDYKIERIAGKIVSAGDPLFKLVK